MLHIRNTHVYYWIYQSITPDAVYKDYLKYIKQLPLNDSPELFGLHENANMTYAQNETFAILDKFLLMQAKTGGGGGKSQEEVCLLFLL